MSSSLKTFLFRHGISSSRSTPYHPTGNGQCERFEGIIWKTITLALESRNISLHHWESVLPDALHSVRSLLCTATNATPHERLFCYPRRTSTGLGLPTWLSSTGPVLLKKYTRQKLDPLVEEVRLLEANPQHALVRFPSGREETVSIEDLAPAGRLTPESNKDSSPAGGSLSDKSSGDFSVDQTMPDVSNHSFSEAVDLERKEPHDDESGLRRSSRVRRPVDRLNL
ncbi:UNVERIFIED_CONTAM: hypothetical protein RMT77_005954 [Armadillidium vulgare]